MVSKNSKFPCSIGIKYILFLLQLTFNAIFKCIFPEQCISHLVGLGQVVDKQEIPTKDKKVLSESYSLFVNNWLIFLI